MLVIGIGCALLVAGGVVWRLASAARDVPRAQRVGLLMSAVHDRTTQRRKPEPLAGQGERTSRR
jgi:hypothetical protein